MSETAPDDLPYTYSVVERRIVNGRVVTTAVIDGELAQFDIDRKTHETIGRLSQEGLPDGEQS